MKHWKSCLMVMMVVLLSTGALFAGPSGHKGKAVAKKPQVKQLVETQKHLIARLNAVKELAMKENATETVAAIDKMIAESKKRIEGIVRKAKAGKKDGAKMARQKEGHKKVSKPKRSKMKKSKQATKG